MVKDATVSTFRDEVDVLVRKCLGQMLYNFHGATTVYLVNSQLGVNQLIGESLNSVIRGNNIRFATDLRSLSPSERVVFYFDMDLDRLPDTMSSVGVLTSLMARIKETSVGNYQYQGLIMSVGSSSANTPCIEPMEFGSRMLKSMVGMSHICLDMAGYLTNKELFSQFEEAKAYRPDCLFSFKYQDAPEIIEKEVERTLGTFLDFKGIESEFDSTLDTIEPQSDEPLADSDENEPAVEARGLAVEPNVGEVKTESVESEAGPDETAEMAPIVRAVAEIQEELEMGLSLTQINADFQRIPFGIKAVFLRTELEGEPMRLAVSNIFGNLEHVFKATNNSSPTLSVMLQNEGGAVTVLDLDTNGETAQISELDILSGELDYQSISLFVAEWAEANEEVLLNHGSAHYLKHYLKG